LTISEITNQSSSHEISLKGDNYRLLAARTDQAQIGDLPAEVYKRARYCDGDAIT